MSFELHPNFNEKIHILDLHLCKVFLENEKNYPWILLIPMKPGIKKIIDLSAEDQILLYQEMSLAQEVMWKIYQPDQINVAAIGNKTPQLHIHVIARFSTDPAWPMTVWDHPKKEKLSSEKISKIADDLRKVFSIYLEKNK